MTKLVERLPITRDYMAADEAALASREGTLDRADVQSWHRATGELRRHANR